MRLTTTILLISLLALPYSGFSAEMPLRKVLTKKYSKQYKKWSDKTVGHNIEGRRNFETDSSFITKIIYQPEKYIKKVKENTDKAERLVKELEMEMRNAIEAGDKRLFDLLKEQAKAMDATVVPGALSFYGDNYTDLRKKTGWDYGKAKKIAQLILNQYIYPYIREDGTQLGDDLQRLSMWTFETGQGLDLSASPGMVNKPGVLDVVPYGQEAEGLRLGETPGEAFFEVIDLQFEKVFQGLFKDYGMALKDCNDIEIQKIDRSIHSLQKTLFERLQRTRIKFKKGNAKWKEFEKKQEKEVLDNIEERLEKWGKEFDKLKNKYNKECKKQKTKTDATKKLSEAGLLSLPDGRTISAMVTREKRETGKPSGGEGLLALPDGKTISAAVSREKGETTEKPGEGGLLALPDGRTISATVTREKGDKGKKPVEAGLLALPDGRTISAAVSREKAKEKTDTGSKPSGEQAPKDVTVGGINVVQIDSSTHHLGDNKFEGNPNSQLQQRSEGASYEKSFQLTAAQLPPNTLTATLTLSAKGAQCNNPVALNGVQVGDLIFATDDGSFHNVNFAVDICTLKNGNNSIKITSVDDGAGIDDFEFKNIRLELMPVAGTDAEDRHLAKLSSVQITDASFGNPLSEVTIDGNFWINPGSGSM